MKIVYYKANILKDAFLKVFWTLNAKIQKS
jgi:hypothetical protein